MEIIKGCSRKGRYVTAAISLSLSALFAVVVLIWGDNAHHSVIPAGLGLFSLVLFTPFWRVFYPVLFAALGAAGIYIGIKDGKIWPFIDAGVMLTLAVVISMEVLHERDAERRTER